MDYRREATLVAENRLLEPVTLAIGDQSLLLEPGDRVRVPVPRNQRLEAHWALVQPTTRDGRVFGEAMEGVFVAQHPSGELPMVITAEHAAAGNRSATPLVVNATSHAFRVTVMTGTDSIECDCYISPGDSLAVGYYALSAAAAVRVTDVLGRTARITGLDKMMQSGSGRVRVRVDSAQMQRATTASEGAGSAASGPAIVF